MSKFSAGILLYRFSGSHCQVFLVHPGGPFFKHKEDQIWSIPKGEFDQEEAPLDAAKREFEEETGYSVDTDKWIELTPRSQSSHKIVYAYAKEGDLEADKIESNTFMMEWPPHSGKMIEVPEVDRGEWFDLDTAHTKIHPGQAGFLEELKQKLNLSRNN